MFYKYLATISLVLSSVLPVLAADVDVTSNTPSGTYHAPVSIELTTTESAKTFYSFKPDGTPNDAYLYTWPILLKQSSPFIYFSVVNTENESKIKQNNYVLEYPTTIHFQSPSFDNGATLGINIVNSGSESVNIGYWYVQSAVDMVTIPAWTMLEPNQVYSTRIKYDGNSALVLRSPDDDERDLMVRENNTESVKVPLPPKKVLPRKIYSISEVRSPKIEVVANVEVVEVIAPTPIQATLTSSASVTPNPPQEEKPTEVVPKVEPVTSSLSIAQMTKVSTGESGQKGVNPLYFAVFLILSLSIGAIQWIRKRK